MFFGRDAQILRGLDVLRGMRRSGVESLFVVLGPSGAGKSSFLRAGLLPTAAPRRPRVPAAAHRAPRARVLTGELGLRTPSTTCAPAGAGRPMLGEIKNACPPSDVEQLRGWLEEARQVARARLLDVR